MSVKDNSPTPLSVMIGRGGNLEAKGKTYTVKPIKLMDIEDFMKDNLSLGAQLFNVSDKKSREIINKWITGYCLDSEGNTVSLEKASNDGWDVVDLKEFMKKLCDISG